MRVRAIHNLPGGKDNVFRHSKLFALILLLLATSLTGCASKPVAPVTIRVGVLPILDTLPLYVAEAEGYFKAENVIVELVPVASAAERDQLLQAGQLDATISDLVALTLANQEGVRLVAVRTAMVATPQYPQFRILAAGSSSHQTPQDLRGVAIGVSQGTVIEYVTTRLLENAGLATADITTLAVPKISDRMSLLQSGGLEAATLPEPLASLALQQGARVIVDDTSAPQYSTSVYVFDAAFLKANPEAVRAFLRAIQKAATTINADKTRWSTLLSEKKLVPAPVLESYVLPDYPEARVPGEEQLNDVVAWLKDKGLLKTTPAYADIIKADWLK